MLHKCIIKIISKSDLLSKHNIISKYDVLFVFFFSFLIFSVVHNGELCNNIKLACNRTLKREKDSGSR